MTLWSRWSRRFDREFNAERTEVAEKKGRVAGARVSEIHGHWAEVRAELLALRASVAELPAGREILGLFDEFLEMDEFGLALESLCDFILEQSAFVISEGTVARVEMLHDRMGVSDGCGAALRIKMRGREVAEGP